MAKKRACKTCNRKVLIDLIHVNTTKHSTWLWWTVICTVPTVSPPTHSATKHAIVIVKL